MKLDENLSKAINYTTMLFSDLGRLLILIVLDINSNSKPSGFGVHRKCDKTAQRL